MKSRKDADSIAMSNSVDADTIQRTSLPPVAQPRARNYASLTQSASQAKKFKEHITENSIQDASLSQTLPARHTVPQYSSVNHLYGSGGCDSGNSAIHQANRTNNKKYKATNENSKKVNVSNNNITLPTTMSNSWSSSFSSFSPHHNAQMHLESKTTTSSTTHNSSGTRINIKKTLPPISTECSNVNNPIPASQSPLHSTTSTRAKMHNVHSFLSFNAVQNATSSFYNVESSSYKNNNIKSSNNSNTMMSTSDMKLSKTDKPTLSFSAKSPLNVDSKPKHTVNRRNSVKELTSMLSLHGNTSPLRKKLLRCHRLTNPEDALNLKSEVPEVEWYVKPAAAASSSSLLLLRQEDAAQGNPQTQSQLASPFQGPRSSVNMNGRGSKVNELVNRQSEAARHERILLSLMSPQQRALKEECARLAAEAAEHKEVQRRKRIRSFLAPVVSPAIPNAQKEKKTNKTQKDKTKNAKASTLTAAARLQGTEQEQEQQEEEQELLEQKRKRKKEKKKLREMEKKAKRRERAEAKQKHKKENNISESHEISKEEEEQEQSLERHEKHVHHKHRHRHKNYEKKESELEKQEEGADTLKQEKDMTLEQEELRTARKNNQEERIKEENEVQELPEAESKVETNVKHHHKHHHRSNNKKEKKEELLHQLKSEQDEEEALDIPMESKEKDKKAKESCQESVQSEEQTPEGIKTGELLVNAPKATQSEEIEHHQNSVKKITSSSSSSSSFDKSYSSITSTRSASSLLSEENESTFSGSNSYSSTSDIESEYEEEEEEEEEEEKEEEEEVINYDDETVAEKKERIEIEVLCYFHELRRRRTRAALTIQCAWRVHVARVALQIRQQVLYYHVYLRQRAAGLCIASWFKTHLLQDAYKSHKQELETKFAERALYEQKLIHAIHVIERSWVKYAPSFRQRRELCIRLKLSKAEELNVFRRAAIILQRWWRLIVPVKAYWVQRAQEVHKAQLQKLREEAQTQAINTIQCVLEKYVTRLALIEWKKIKQTKRQIFMSRVRAASDVIANVLKEYCLRRHRLAREHMANQWASLEHIQQEWKEALGRRVLMQYVQLFTSMHHAACLIQHQWRLYHSGRERRYLRELSRTATKERIEWEFVYYRAIIALQNFARLILFKKKLVEMKAQKGRKFIESIWLMQRTGRGKLHRAALSNMHTKHIQEIAEAKELAAHLSLIKQITLTRVALARECVLKELNLQRAKEAELHELKIIALRELQQDHCASVIQRAWRRHVKRVADAAIEQTRNEALEYIHKCIVSLQCAWRQYKARQALRAKMTEKKCYEATRGLHEEVLDALYCEQLNTQVAHTKPICNSFIKNRMICKSVDDKNFQNATNEPESSIYNDNHNNHNNENEKDDSWALLYDFE